jgi:penicillin-binding protein 2
MDRLIKRGRLIFLCLLLIALVATYAAALYKLQVVEGAKYYEQSQNSIVTTQTVTAVRGDILDRYGRVLVSNRSCNNLTINSDELFEQDDPNAIILELCETVTECGDTYADELPISMDAPFEFDEDMSDVDRERLNEYLDNKGLDRNISAVELMAYFRERFDIDANYDSRQTRIIAGIRYALNMHYIVKTSDYVFAEDVSIELITRLMEGSLVGYNVEVSYTREYNTIYASHLLGYVTSIYSDEADYYTELGYPLNAQVGREGAEQAFEEYLHGEDGEAKITSTSSGTVTNIVYTKEPEPGNNVYLTIDIGLQETAEQALGSYITQKNDELAAEGSTELITGGAVVAVDVKTGEPLTVASYPNYDLSTILEDYDDLLADENSPLFNRAINGIYAPGSTFKPCVSIAAMAEGKITPETTVYDEVTYTKYTDYQPSCWIKGQGTHGTVNVSGALKVSCNYFFYMVGDMLGADTIARYARLFGLGEATGIELNESLGTVSCAETKKQLLGEEDGTWYVGDSLQTAIGQSYNQYTPLQLATYIATIANGGTRYSTSMLKAVRSYDYSENIFERTPQILSTVDVDSSYFDAVHQGMWAVANSTDGTAYSIFGNYAYCEVAAKTGTAQMGDGVANNAVFVCYAPADDPEIAVAVVVEKGIAGSSIGTIAKQVLDYYFSFTTGDTLETEGELLH